MSVEELVQNPTLARCGLCGAPGEPFRRKYGFDVLLCKACSNAFVPSSLVPADLESIYSRAYFEGEQATGYPGYLRDTKILTENFASRLRLIEGLGVPGRRLCDVGAAYGLFLKAARDAGWEASGVEIAADCAPIAESISGVSVVCGDFNTVPLGGPFDVIVMLDVIEHFRDPVASVARAYELLSPGGLLVIETGDLAAPWARLLGERWYFLDPPQHLFYFSVEGLTELLHRAGFGEVQVRRPGRRVSSANICFKLAAGAPVKALRKALSSASKFELGSIYLNFGDCMLLAARKP
jgi:SAM-dependent methyltransferase